MTVLLPNQIKSSNAFLFSLSLLINLSSFIYVYGDAGFHCEDAHKKFVFLFNTYMCPIFPVYTSEVHIKFFLLEDAHVGLLTFVLACSRGGAGKTAKRSSSVGETVYGEGNSTRQGVCYFL